jgi:hypothetical protein
VECMYDLVAVDMFVAEAKVDHVASRVELPAVHVEGPDSLPRLIVVNAQLPHDTWGYNHQTTQLVFYMAVRPETLAAAADLSAPSTSNAVRLLKKWVTQAPTDKAVRETFKVIGMVDNIDDLGLGSFIAGYNGKPVLITRSGSFFQGNGYIEMDINVHSFNIIARKALQQLKARIKEMEMRIGFVIQGQRDDELPEAVLGACELHRVDVCAAKAVPALSVA